MSIHGRSWFIRVCTHGHRVEWRDRMERWQHMDADGQYCDELNEAVEVVESLGSVSRRLTAQAGALGSTHSSEEGS